MDIILFSHSGSDEDIATVAETLFTPKGAMVFTFARGLDAKAIEKRLKTGPDGSKARAVVFPHSHLVDWPFGILLQAKREFRAAGDKVFVDASFLRRNPFPFSAFLTRSRGASFFAANGRFDDDDGKYFYAFPTWEVARVSLDLWTDPEFDSFVNGTPATTSANTKLHAARTFYDHFSQKHELKSLVQSVKAKSFDPVGTKEVNLSHLLTSGA